MLISRAIDSSSELSVKSQISFMPNKAAELDYLINNLIFERQPLLAMNNFQFW